MDKNRAALTGDNLPISVNVGSYTANLFTDMGVPALVGRQFNPAAAHNGNASPVAVPSYLFWKKQYGGESSIIGKTIELDHVLYTVIGVANPRFTWGDSDVYIPAISKLIRTTMSCPSSSLSPAQPARASPPSYNRAKGDPAVAMRAVAQSIHRLNPGIFVTQQHEFSWVLDNEGWATERFLASSLPSLPSSPCCLQPRVSTASSLTPSPNEPGSSASAWLSEPHVRPSLASSSRPRSSRLPSAHWWALPQPLSRQTHRYAPLHHPRPAHACRSLRHAAGRDRAGLPLSSLACSIHRSHAIAAPRVESKDMDSITQRLQPLAT
jgi:MacB-like periplasmic core domain